jgi:hypothetical protein
MLPFAAPAGTFSPDGENRPVNGWGGTQTGAIAMAIAPVSLPAPEKLISGRSTGSSVSEHERNTQGGDRLAAAKLSCSPPDGYGPYFHHLPLLQTLADDCT